VNFYSVGKTPNTHWNVRVGSNSLSLSLSPPQCRVTETEVLPVPISPQPSPQKCVPAILVRGRELEKGREVVLKKGGRNRKRT